MFTSVSAIGYAPGNIRYCPECGTGGFPQVTYGDGKMKCDKCGLTVYMVEAGDSHQESEDENEYKIV